MRRVVVFAAVTAAAVSATAFVSMDDGYRVSVMLPSATNIANGSSVESNGFPIGTVAEIEPVDGHARITMELEGDSVPLHDGAVVHVRWKALVGERHVTITDGSAKNAEIPNGGMIKGSMPQPMELDHVFAALDEPTRKHINSLLANLDQTLDGHTGDLNDTIRRGGPALAEVGEVLRGLGADGEAIKALVRQVENMVGTLSRRDGQVTTIVDQLSRLSARAVSQRRALGETLDRLPGTAETAQSTLDEVPAAVREVSPLLTALEPATRKLRGAAGELRPVLTDLRPLVADLRPALASARTLLGRTPGLLDRAHEVLPEANSMLTDLLPAVDFLRPYTPELAGVFAGWGSMSANYGGIGHYARPLAEFGASSVNVNPGVMPPGFRQESTPAPGSLVGQPWTDATGGGVK